ncbi:MULTISPECIES: hypothetical protein [unclassified Novosphingobium]|uniref:hypothetical protein n=1 Tax=unclassified Novosphingobium TaxID=2644732 RepID=UPI00146D6D21|nr:MULTISPECIES: hypothetical protein [unclassified Novosphingobium]NMN07506.1 hypothetical protein [Novosphingobium sp. SG919]NMN89807.1 hypothetical protein [Novosphingobium sp. SG916]
MNTAIDLLPDLQAWNDGRGVKPEDWLCAIARSDQAVAFTALFWPKIIVYKDYVLRHDFSVEKLRNSETGGHTRAQIEAALNYNSLEAFFRGGNEIEAIAQERARYVCKIMVDMLDAKLRRDFPARRCKVEFVDNEDDFAVTFWQE